MQYAERYSVSLNSILEFMLIFLVKEAKEKDEIIKRIIKSGLILKDNSSKRYNIYLLTYNFSRANNIFFCRSTLILLLNVRQRKWRSLISKVNEGIKETEKITKRKRDRGKKVH